MLFLNKNKVPYRKVQATPHGKEATREGRLRLTTPQILFSPGTGVQCKPLL